MQGSLGTIVHAKFTQAIGQLRQLISERAIFDVLLVQEALLECLLLVGPAGGLVDVTLVLRMPILIIPILRLSLS